LNLSYDDDINLPREWNVIKLSHKSGSSNYAGVCQIAVHCTSGTVRKTEEGCDVAVWSGTTKSATSIASLGNVRAGALSGVESASALLAV